jgi:hypothetical protein
VSLREGERFHVEQIPSHQKVTDVYLLGVARRHGGRLATLDRSIPFAAVSGASSQDILIVSEGRTV